MEQEFLEFLKELEQSNETWKNELDIRLTSLENLLDSSNQSATQSHSDKNSVMESVKQLINNQAILDKKLNGLRNQLGNYESQQKQIEQNAKEISQILEILEALQG